MAYKPGESFLETLGSLSTIRSKERAQTFSEAMGASQEKRAWEQLKAQVGMFKSTESRLESNAMIRAMIELYGIEKQDDWERLRASSRAEILNMLPWLQYGANINSSMNTANFKGLKEEGGSPRAAAMIESTKSFINSTPPDYIFENGISAADSAEAMIKNLNNMPQTKSGKMRVSVLAKMNPLFGIGGPDYLFAEKDIGSYTDIKATSPEGQEILDKVIQEKFKAGIGTKGKASFGAEKGGYPNSIPIDADGGVSSINLLQESLQHILGELPSDEYGRVVDEKSGEVLLIGSPVQDAAMTAEAWLGAKNDKNNLIAQSVQRILASKGIQLDDRVVLTPSQYEAVKFLADYRDQQYGLYNRMPAQDRAAKYGIVGYLQGQTESAKNLYNYMENLQEAASKKQNIPRMKPPLPEKLPKQDSTAYTETKEATANYIRPAIQRILSITADREIKGSPLDKAVIDELGLMMAEIYLQQGKGNRDAMHNEAIDLLNYINDRVEVDDEFAYAPESIAPSEARDFYFYLTIPEEQNGMGLSFTDKEEELWRFLVTGK